MHRKQYRVYFREHQTSYYSVSATGIGPAIRQARQCARGLYGATRLHVARVVAI